MAGITSLVASFFSPGALSLAPGSSSAPQPTLQPSPGPPDKTDAFEQGQPWKNQARPLTPAGPAHLFGCKCGNCGICAARTYQLNQPGWGGFFPGPPGNESHSEISQNSQDRQTGRDFQPKTAQTARPSGNSAESSPDPESAKSQQAAPENNYSTETPENGVAGPALSPPELAEIAQLRKIDTRVRAHEMAHLAVAGALARGGANFAFQTGPDGRKYAVGGEVSIDTSKEGSPEATLTKMRKVRAAALAPADPSPQDKKVAALAAAAMTEAVREIRLDKTEETKAQKTEDVEQTDNSRKASFKIRD